MNKEKIGIVVFLLAMLNFSVFWVVGVSIGGDAVAGKIENGHYYVSNHGTLTEVSAFVFYYSLIHTYSIWVTHPLGILALGLFASKPKS